MTLLKCLYLIGKFTFLNEVLGFVYWALVIFGLFSLLTWLDSEDIGALLVAIVAFTYIVIAACAYVYSLSKIHKFVKGRRSDL